MREAALIDDHVGRLCSETAADDSWLTQQLVSAMGELASREPLVRRNLVDWLARHAPAADSGAVANTIGGSAVLFGPSVQAGGVYGDIHIYQEDAQDRVRAPRPRQLLPVRPHFIDREVDMRALDEQLLAGRRAQAPQLLVVSGFAGVGKTTLVSKWLHIRVDDFPDGQLYADLGGGDNGAGDRPVPVAAGAILEGFLHALGVTSLPAETAQRAALWRSLTSNMRFVVLLDNAYTAAQVRPLLPSATSGLTVVTSRNQLTGLLVDGAALYRLNPLPPDSAVELLAKGGGGTRVDQDPAAAREVVALCAHLPLAVCLAAAQLAARPHHSVSALAESLAREHGPLDSLQADGEAMVRSALDLSYDLLPSDAALLYRCMGLLPADRYDIFLLRSISPADVIGPERVEAAIGALIEANLLVETGPGAYRFHDLVRLHASHRGAAEDEARREETLRQFADWCLVTATAAESLLTPSHRTLDRPPLSLDIQPTPHEDAAKALTWLDENRVGLMGAVRQSAEAGRYDTAWQLVDAMWPFFQRLRPADWIDAHRMGLMSARAAGSRKGEGRMLTSGAIGLRTAGEYVEATRWYKEALDLATADSDVRQQAQALNGLGHVELLTGNFEDGQAYFLRALHLRESVCYWRGAALSRIRLGETALAMGDPAEAARYLTRAHHDLRQMGETYESARALALLGHALVDAEDTVDGARQLRAALDVFRHPATRSTYQEGRVLEWLASAAEHLGEEEEARRCYEAARDLFRLTSPADAERIEDRLHQG